jgi:hypothetical protein
VDIEDDAAHRPVNDERPDASGNVDENIKIKIRKMLQVGLHPGTPNEEAKRSLKLAHRCQKCKPSSDEQLYPTVSQAEIHEVSLVSSDTLFTAFCKAMWQNPIRVEIENVLQADFKVLDHCLQRFYFEPLKPLQGLSDKVWQTNGARSEAFYAVV